MHYIIQDGGSTDKTVHIATQIAFEYSNNKNIVIEINSGADNGMYDALSNAFISLSKGDVYHYINAGDYYSPYAFEIVFEIISQHSISFLTGLNCEYNEKNHLVNVRLPFSYSRSLLLSGMYGTILPFIQQESTFWDYELQKLIDLDELKKMKFAGDFFLWRTFITHSKLYIVNAHLGGFKVHDNQLSYNRGQYQEEMARYTKKTTLVTLMHAYIHKIMWYAPHKIKNYFSGDIFFYDYKSKRYSRGVCP